MFARRASTRGQGKVPCACVCIRRCIIGRLCANRASPLNLLQQNFRAAAIIKEVLADPQKRAAAYAEMEVGAGMPPGSRLVWRRHVDGIARTWSDACDVALRIRASLRCRVQVWAAEKAAAIRAGLIPV